MHSPDRAPPLRQLVCDGLHYCCPFAFFAVMKKRDSSVIADRLGCQVRTVQEWRRRFRAGEIYCEKAEKCYYEQLLLMGEIADRREYDRDTDT